MERIEDDGRCGQNHSMDPPGWDNADAPLNTGASGSGADAAGQQAVWEKIQYSIRRQQERQQETERQVLSHRRMRNNEMLRYLGEKRT